MVVTSPRGPGPRPWQLRDDAARALRLFERAGTADELIGQALLSLIRVELAERRFAAPDERPRAVKTPPASPSTALRARLAGRSRLPMVAPPCQRS